jgi:large subunit ribosomal protein L17
MRHRKATRKLGRPRNQRRALIKGLVRSLLDHEKIRTTVDRAKAAEIIAEKLITCAKNDSMHARRQVRRYIAIHDRMKRGGRREPRVSRNEELVKKLFGEIAPRMEDRQGGYTRLTMIDRRRGDGATLAVLELVGED